MPIKNNWYVISGGPSSGKSTTLAHLEKLGYLVVPEAARVYIDAKLAEGQTIAEIRANEEDFQDQILRMKLAVEGTMAPNETFFLDRGMHDSLAYVRLYGYTINQTLRDALASSRYQAVFLLEMLDFEEDYARTENKEAALRLESLLEEAYTEYTLPVIRIPRAPIEERVKRILKLVN